MDELGNPFNVTVEAMRPATDWWKGAEHDWRPRHGHGHKRRERYQHDPLDATPPVGAEHRDDGRAGIRRADRLAAEALFAPTGFVLASGAAYIVNDVRHVDADSLNPMKRKRPLPQPSQPLATR
jgi:hypothetical protein